jgi:choice-of-anchor B domain-containing protein
MKKLLTFMVSAVLLTHSLSAQNFNLTLRSTVTYGVELANIWGHVDAQGNEYALVGYYDGLSIVDVTDPDNPFIAFTVNGPQSSWREIKTWQNYAYVTTESGSQGLQIINLNYLPDSVQTRTWDGSGTIAGQLETIHSLHVDDAYVYLHGTNLFGGATLLVDLTDPWNPVYMGVTPGSYVHDGYVRNDTLWSANIFSGYFGVYDVSDKTNPLLLAQQNTPTNFTHNTWLNDEGSVLFTTDETNDSYLATYDITDLGNITELDRFQTTPGSGSIVHNTQVVNDYAVNSWYKDGFNIVDGSRPTNLVEVARYDTYTQGSGGGFSGCWGVYPFLPSGTIVASDIDNGLYVLTPNYQRACWLEGIVVDSITGLPLSNATVDVIGLPLNETTGVSGEFKTGTVTAGTYDVEVSRLGYATKVITGVNLVNNLLTTLTVELNPISAFTATGQVINGASGAGIPNAQVNITNANFDLVVTTDANGDFTIPGFFPDNYNVDGGSWGYITYCVDNLPINATTGPLTISLMPGIYDDFTFDFGWTVSGTSGNEWERGEPVGTTTNGGSQANPQVDANGDCRDQAYVTDNGGGGVWSHDVDGGNTILTSPVWDASNFLNPMVHYYRWFYNGGNNGGGPADDTMTVSLFNGSTTVVLEQMFPSSPNNSSWVSQSYFINQFLPATSTMQLIVETADWGPVFNIVEGGLDRFEATEGPVGIEESDDVFALSAYPNPFTDVISISYDISNLTGDALLELTDMSGRIISSVTLKQGSNKIELNEEISSGMYFLRIVAGNTYSKPVRITKTQN